MKDQFNLNTIILGLLGVLSGFIYKRIDSKIDLVDNHETRISVLEDWRKDKEPKYSLNENLHTAVLPKNKLLTKK